MDNAGLGVFQRDFTPTMTAPVASFTVPSTVAVSNCAMAVAVNANSNANIDLDMTDTPLYRSPAMAGLECAL